MMTKKQIMGSEVKFDYTLLQAIQDFLGVHKPEPKSIRFATKEYRSFKKSVVERGKTTQWRGVTTGREKEQIGLKRIQERYGRGGF